MRAPVLSALAAAMALQLHTTRAMMPEPAHDDDSLAADALAATASRRALIKSVRGLQAGDGWIAQVEGGDAACADVAAAADVWKREHAAFSTLRSIGGAREDEADARTIAMQRTCFVSFTGSSALADFVRSSLPGVLNVEPDLVVTTEAAPRSWGLDRVDQSDLPLSNTDILASHDGIGVNVYVIDTGINADHDDFGGRAQYGASFVTGESQPDGNGHGSHCAGTAVGATYGIARRATVFGVKVLAASGSGSTSGVIDGIRWAVQHQMDAYDGEAAVLSLSLGGGSSAAMNAAVREAAQAGMIVVVAAGNEAQDACNTSPAGAGGNARNGGVISVGSTTSSDAMSSFSNYGACTDVFAPGSSITSAWKGSASATRTISGTSMAAPHVAGVAAVLLQKHDKDRDAAQQELMSLLVQGKISQLGLRSPNLLLQVPTYTGPPTPPTQSPTMPPTRAPAKMCVGALCVEFAMSSFGPGLPARELVRAPLAVARSSPFMCVATAEDFTGKVVIVQRGDCLFFDKVKTAELQGAAAVLVMLTSPFDVIFEPGYYGDDSTDIPSAMISMADGDALVARAGETLVMGSPSNTPAPVGPTRAPTRKPTAAPVTQRPSTSPSRAPSNRPTARPTLAPSVSPTERPTQQPTTARPSRSPTSFPTARPTVDVCATKRQSACRRSAVCAWTRVLAVSARNKCYAKTATAPPTPLAQVLKFSACEAGSAARAEQVCADSGRRVCSLQQLQAQPLDGASECELDEAWVWTNTKCTGDRQRVFMRRGKRSKCRATVGSASIRCC